MTEATPASSRASSREERALKPWATAAISTDKPFSIEAARAAAVSASAEAVGHNPWSSSSVEHMQNGLPHQAMFIISILAIKITIDINSEIVKRHLKRLQGLLSK
jgi:hypothetical protein